MTAEKRYNTNMNWILSEFAFSQLRKHCFLIYLYLQWIVPWLLRVSTHWAEQGQSEKCWLRLNRLKTLTVSPGTTAPGRSLLDTLSLLHYCWSCSKQCNNERASVSWAQPLPCTLHPAPLCFWARHHNPTVFDTFPYCSPTFSFLAGWWLQ